MISHIWLILLLLRLLALWSERTGVLPLTISEVMGQLLILSRPSLLVCYNGDN